MGATTELPTWAVFLISLGTPLLAFAGALVGQVLNRRGAKELETRSKREETMRNLRWAAALAVSPDEGQAALGVSQLEALGESDLLDSEQQVFVDAALEAVLNEPLEELEGAGEDADVVLEEGPNTLAALESKQEADLSIHGRH